MNIVPHISFSLLVLGSVSGVGRVPNAQGTTQAAPQSPEDFERNGVSAESIGDFVLARKLYEEACKSIQELNPDFKGEQSWVRVSALCRLGKLLRTGKGGPANPTRAARCFVLALGIGANERSAGAWIELIEMYRKGEGVTKNIQFAQHLFFEFAFYLGAQNWSDEDKELGSKYIEANRGDKSLHAAVSRTTPKQNSSRAWKGTSGPPPEDLDESRDESFHKKMSEESRDPIHSLFHRLWAQYLTPGC